MEKKGKAGLTLAIIAAVVIVLGVLGYAFRDTIFPSDDSKDGESVSIFDRIIGDVDSENEGSSAQFTYPEEWAPLELNEGEINAGILFRLEREKPEGQLIIRTIYGELEDGIKMPKLENTVVDALQAGIDDFTLIDSDVDKISGFDVVMITYDQDQDATEEMEAGTYTNRMIIIPTPHQTFYLTFRAEEDDYSDISNEMSTITSSFGSYIDTRLEELEEEREKAEEAEDDKKKDDEE
ncbi:hypothetical protein ACFL2D_00335 [Patescibacteria group bacterium]